MWKYFNTVLFNIVTLCLLSLSFIGCDGITGNNNSQPTGKGILQISAEKTEYSSEISRTILPSTTVSDLTDFVLLIKDSDGIINNTFSFPDYDSLVESKIGIETGTWTFTLTSGDFSGTLTKTIEEGNNSLSFMLEYVGASETGDFDITLSIPKDDRFKTITCSLLNIITENEVTNFESEILTLKQKNERLEAVYSKENVPAGYYLLEWNVYGDLNKKILLDTRKDVLQIESGFSTKQTLEICDNLDLYTISYNMGNGFFKEDIEIPYVFTQLSDFDLPDYKIALCDGRFFEGWYENPDFSGKKVNSVNKGMNHDFTFYAKWKDEEVCLVENNDSAQKIEDYKLVQLKKGEEVEFTYYMQAGFTYYCDWVDTNTNNEELLVSNDYLSIDAKIEIIADTICAENDDEISFSFTPENTGYYKVHITNLSEQSGGYCAFNLYKAPNTYSLNFNLNDGQISDDCEIPNEYNSIEELVLPEGNYLSRPYCIFTGWYETSECNTEPITRIPAGSYGDRTLYAGWQGEVFKIAYELNGGQNSAENPVYFTVLDSTNLIEATRIGYDFGGWYVSVAEENIKISKISDLLLSENQTIEIDNLCLEAEWTLSNYQINYDLNGGNFVYLEEETPVEQIYTIHDSIELKVPSKLGYTFGGWYKSSDFSEEPITEICEGTYGDIALYAKWTATVYTITYIIEDGKNRPENPLTYTYESPEITLLDPFRRGYSFEGWFTDSTFDAETECSVIPAESIGNRTFYAKWKHNMYTISYSTAYGMAPAEINVDTETLTEEQLPKLEEDGWDFLGWYIDDTEVTTETVITGDVTLTAKWTLKEYTVTYNTNGGSLENAVEKYTVETETFSLPEPVREGYAFSGWYLNENFSGLKQTSITKGSTGNKNYYAKWKEKYDASFVLVEGDGTVSSFYMSPYETTQKLYTEVMGKNPSNFSTNPASGETQELRPVEQVSWYDAIYFCNKYSESKGLTPCYSVNGSTDVSTWGYTPHKGNSISGKIECNFDADGYRLPTVAEWKYAAKGGKNKDSYTYSGSNNLDDVAWYYDNSGNKTHEVGLKKANSLGIYDMSGNVFEWCWDVDPYLSSYRCRCGGSYYYYARYCEVDYRDYGSASIQRDYVGFRLVRLF